MSDISYERYCPKCGDITLTKEENKKCRFCGEPYLPTQYTLQDTFKGIGVHKRIFEEYIKDNPQFDEDLYAQRVGKEKLMQEATSDRLKEQNKPKCPTCGSTKVHPISSGKKALGFLTVGVFSSSFGKNYECENCKYKW